MKLYFTPEAYQKVQALVVNCETEVMGLGRTKVIGANKVVVDDISIFEQTATGASTEFSDVDHLFAFLKERMAIGDASDWRLWWHSHAAMETFFSAIDTDNIELLGKTADWLISAVFNHKMDWKGRVDTFRPFRITLENIALGFHIEGSEATEDWAMKELETKINTKPKWQWEGKKENGYFPDEDKDFDKELDKDPPFTKIQAIKDKLENGCDYKHLSKKEKKLVGLYPVWFSEITGE